jgi:hypothetical protein
MSIIGKLATSLGRRDENPNIDLAKQIAAANNKKVVKELVEHLHDKSKDIRHDCIKTLYEIAYLKPHLISDYVEDFIEQLDSKSNRMQWGAMTALSSIVKEKPGELYKALPKIIDVANKGSVITKDHYVNILIGLCSDKAYYNKAFPLLIEQLLKSATNQLPKYAELSMPIVTEKDKKSFLKALKARVNDIETPTKRVRLEKVIKKLEA